MLIITEILRFYDFQKNIYSNFLKIDNYFVASGTNGHGIALAGGIGKYMAELIRTGNTDFSMWPIDIRRFMRLHTNKRFLEDRLKEIPGLFFFVK